MSDYEPAITDWLRQRAETAEALVSQQRSGIRDVQRTCRELEIEVRRLQQRIPYAEWLATLTAVRDGLRPPLPAWKAWVVRRILCQTLPAATASLNAVIWSLEASQDRHLSATAEKVCATLLREPNSEP
jgi:hypothetical protein